MCGFIRLFLTHRIRMMMISFLWISSIELFTDPSSLKHSFTKLKFETSIFPPAPPLPTLSYSPFPTTTCFHSLFFLILSLKLDFFMPGCKAYFNQAWLVLVRPFAYKCPDSEKNLFFLKGIFLSSLGKLLRSKWEMNKLAFKKFPLNNAFILLSPSS